MLSEQIEKLRLEDVVRKREIDEMKSLVENLRKEIEDKLDMAEEDRRKARESLRWAEWKAKNRESAMEDSESTENAPYNTGNGNNSNGTMNIPREDTTLEVTKKDNINIPKEVESEIIPSSALAPASEGNNKDGVELTEINKQIKDLNKKKRGKSS